MRNRSSFGAMALLVASLGCSKPTSDAPSVARAGCQKDADCNGDRVCEDGQCVVPPSRTVASAPAASPSPSAPASQDGSIPHSASVPGGACAVLDGLKAEAGRTAGTSRVVVAPAETASRLAVYTSGSLSILAPRGWTCEGVSAVDGSDSIAVFPPGSAKPAGSFKASSGQGVTAISIPACQGCVATLACPLFPSALKDWPGMTCDALPKAERVARPNARTAYFEDPAGVAGDGDPSGGPFPANGVLLFSPADGDHGASGAEATCTLPEAEHALCTVVLNDFLKNR